MGMLVKGVWHQEDPPMAVGDGSFIRPEFGVPRPCNARRLIGLQGRGRAVFADNRAVMSMGAPHGVDARAQRARRRRSRSCSRTCQRGRAGLILAALTASSRSAASSMCIRSTAPRAAISRAAPPCRCCGTARHGPSSIMNPSEIIRMLNAEFDDFGNPQPTFTPSTARCDRRNQRFCLRGDQ